MAYLLDDGVRFGAKINIIKSMFCFSGRKDGETGDEEEKIKKNRKKSRLLKTLSGPERSLTFQTPHDNERQESRGKIWLISKDWGTIPEKKSRSDLQRTLLDCKCQNFVVKKQRPKAS